MPGFVDILKDVLPAAGNIGAAVLANRAQAGGLSNAQENLQQAYNLGTGAINQAVGGSVPYANWALGQGNALNNWNYGQGMNNLNWGFDQSRNALASGMNNATGVMNQGFNAGMGFLTPYSQLGSNALSAVQSHVFGTPRTTPATVTAPQFNLPQVGMNALQRPTQTPPPNMSPVPKYNALTGMGASGTGGLQNALSGETVSGPGAGSAIGGIAGSVGGGIAGGLIGGAAIGGPIGAAVGALVSPLIGRLTRRGREKEAASKVANDLGTWIEGLYSQLKTGQITPEVFQAAVIQGKKEYDTWVDNSLQDDFVKSNSKTDQAKWINQSMAQKGFSFTV